MSLFKSHSRLCTPTTTKTFSHLSLFIRNLTNPTQTTTKSLHLLFQEAVGLVETPQTQPQTETDELQKGLREIEEEVRHLKANPNNQENVKENANIEEEPNKDKKMVLSSLFFNKKRRQEEAKRARREEEEPKVFKELSPDMRKLLSHLLQKGYFKKANFLPDDKRNLDLNYFNDSYSRSFIKFAADRFGKDNQEIAKWLSGSDLKKVVLLGCPSLSKKSVFSAKQLRNFFGIQEDTVCSKCVLRHSCNFVNQSVWKGGNKNLRLADVMRVITLYTMESVPPELQVPDDVKASISQLLKEVINLSETTSKATSKSASGDNQVPQG